VVFSGTRKGRHVDAGVYSKALDVREWLRIASAGGALREVSGSLADAQARVSGPLEEPTIEGTFRIAQLAYRHFELSDCPGSLRLQLRGLNAPRPQLIGDVSCQAGTIAARNTTVKLQPSRVGYSGDPLAPSFALKGTAVIEGTKIALALTGTPENPRLALSSDPPMSERRLLLMVATGKSWKETEGALAQGQLSTDLVKDFLDYFVLGGLGGKLTRSFGISDVSLMYDSQTRATGIGVTIADRLQTQYEVQPGEADPAEAASASAGERQAEVHKVGVEYRVTSNTSVELEGQREAPSPQQPSAQVSQTEQAEAQPDEQLLLKIKRKF
jgi:autotransporter translocation and assembly factor TamB